MTTTRDRLRAWARGLLPAEACVELLIGAGLADTYAPWMLDDGEHLRIDADRLDAAARTLPPGDQRLTRIALSLLTGRPVNLADDVAGLDRRQVTLVLAAVSHAAGTHRESSLTFDDEGRPWGFQTLPAVYPWP